MTVPALTRLVVGVDAVADAASIFEQKLELPGRAEGESQVIPIGSAEIELSASAQPRGLSRLVLECDDLAACERRLAERGIPFERDASGALRLGGEATHGVTLEIRGPAARA